MENALKVLLNSIYSFVSLFVIAKMLGKKQIAELDFTDYIVGITIGSIAAEWSTDLEDKPWFYYLIAVGVFFVLSFLITLLERTTPILKSILRGKPIMLIEKGKINYKNLKKSKLDVNDLLGMCRAENYFDINDIEYGIFETSGEISILPTGEQKPIVIKDMQINPSPAGMISYIIIDGNIVKNALESINKTESWLMEKLKLKNKAELKNIILCGYNENTQKLSTHYKN